MDTLGVAYLLRDAEVSLTSLTSEAICGGAGVVRGGVPKIEVWLGLPGVTFNIPAFLSEANSVEAPLSVVPRTEFS